MSDAVRLAQRADGGDWLVELIKIGENKGLPMTRKIFWEVVGFMAIWDLKKLIGHVDEILWVFSTGSLCLGSSVNGHDLPDTMKKTLKGTVFCLPLAILRPTVALPAPLLVLTTTRVMIRGP